MQASVRARATGRGAVRMAAQARGTGKFIVGGNWKCNGDTNSIKSLIADLNSGAVNTDVDIVCAPPMVYLPMVRIPPQKFWNAKFNNNLSRFMGFGNEGSHDSRAYMGYVHRNPFLEYVKTVLKTSYTATTF